MTKPRSKINAVEMVRGIREAHYEKIKDLSRAAKASAKTLSTHWSSLCFYMS